MEKLLTPQQLSDHLQVKLSTVYKWTHYKYIPHVKIGDLVRFKESKIIIRLEKRIRPGRDCYKIKL